MIVGFTGSREGMSEHQRTEVRRLLSSLVSVTEFHHGDCVGSDAQAHDIAVSMAIPVIIHPPVKDTARAYCAGWVLDPLPYLERDRAIVDVCTVLIATPLGEEAANFRSGTWTTVRYARKAGRQVYVVSRQV